MHLVKEKSRKSFVELKNLQNWKQNLYMFLIWIWYWEDFIENIYIQIWKMKMSIEQWK